MKTIGLVGGMSWESTTTYYQLINEEIKTQLGGLHSAKILLYSVDFAEIEQCQARGDWDKSAVLLSNAALRLQKAGADFIVICTNTMHKVAPQIQAAISVPLVHIADATADVLLARGMDTVALLGTKYTMTENFYKARLEAKNLRVLVPDAGSVDLVNRVIYEELCLGILNQESKCRYVEIIHQLAEAGAQGVILGCTEIGLLIQQEDVALPVFDTTAIHAKRAAMLAL